MAGDPMCNRPRGTALGMSVATGSGSGAASHFLSSVLVYANKGQRQMGSALINTIFV